MIGKFENGESFLLPGGYVDADCELLREVEIAALSGRDEELISPRQPISNPALLTLLLSRCVLRLGRVRPVSEDLVRRLLVADRQFLLLKLRQMTFGDHVQSTVQCPWELCREKIDIDFFLQDIPVRESKEKGPLYTRELSSEAAFSNEHGEQYREVVFRLPNGEDQEAIAHRVEEDEPAALALLLARCIRRLGPLNDPGLKVIHRLSSFARAEIERHMEEAAPQLDLTLAAHCPECRREFTVPFDLQGFFLAEGQRSREFLYREVHCLAYHYHWSEHEIMSLPREKRQKYIALLADELRSVSRVV
jgi:hypothetical protein